MRTPPRPAALACSLCLAALLLAPPALARASAQLGFKPGSEGFDLRAEEADGSPDLAAGTHPYRLTATLNFTEGPEVPGQPGVPFPAEDPRDMRFELPPGLVGNPSVVTRCTLAQLNTPRSSPYEESRSGESCPDKSQVGTITIRTSLQGGQARSFGLFSLTPPPGVAAELGASPFGEPIAFAGQLRNKQGEYGLDLEARNLSQGLAVDGVTIAVWGAPWAASHDTERGDCLNEEEPSFGWGKCSVGPPKTNRVKAFLTLPASCGEPLVYAVSADSWQRPGRWASDTALSRNAQGEAAGLGLCGNLHFSTTSYSGPTTNRTSTASGYDFELSQNPEGLTEPGKTAPTQVQKAIVSLPDGFTVNPSLGAGLGFCTTAQLARETPASRPGEGCPNDSKIGSLAVQTPLLVEEATGFEAPVDGSIYLAQPYRNPYGSLIAVYLIARAENGVFVKVVGRLLPDPQTGTITAIFEGLPQLPYSHLRVHFREGQRAPLATPYACGSYVTQVELTPWQSETAVSPVVEHQNFSFALSSGPGGGPCPAPGPAPFSPGAANGSQNSQAGAYSPFFLHLHRNDAEAEITSYSALLPPGLTGKLTGTSFCPESDLETAKQKSGAEELEHPSCPADSEIGHTSAGYGLGGVLTYAPGKLYLAGPYHGAPLSIVAVDSALVGPFDLGVIVVRQAIEINPETAQVSLDAAASDPIPHIIDGIPVHLRDIRVYVSKPHLTLNPTSCAPFQTSSTLSGSSPPFANPRESSATVSNLFQVSGCSSLGFRPRFSIRLLGGTRRGAFPALRASFTERAGDANPAYAQVTLPHAEFLAQEHVKTFCTVRQFKLQACPRGSIYGYAKAITPLLPEPLKGPVYVRSGTHLLPDMVVALRGDGGIAVNLVGRVDSVHGAMRASFATLPDAPASRFVLTLFGGRRGLLVNSTDLCSAPLLATARFAAHDNAAIAARVPLRSRCQRRRHHRSKHSKHRKHRKRKRRRG